MSHNRVGPGVYLDNGTEPLNHGAPVVNAGFVGIPAKQTVRSYDQGPASHTIIDPHENYFLVTKGIVTVPNTGLTDATTGDEAYISPDGELTRRLGRLPIRANPPHRRTTRHPPESRPNRPRRQKLVLKPIF